MKVWKINREGLGDTLFLKSLDDLEGNQGTVDDYEVGDKLHVEVIEMEEQIFNNLPDFECFQ